jgi:hypothetical protein
MINLKLIDATLQYESFDSFRINTAKKATHTSPDIYVEQSVADFMNEKDTVLEYVKK